MLIDPFLTTLFSALLGLIVGSFISMLSWRLPRMLELEPEEQFKIISIHRSHCPHCQTPLPWYRLIPLFSWLISLGKCHSCQQKISPRYPLIEISTALLTVYIIHHFDVTLVGFIALVFTWFLITICVIDIEHQLILDKLSLPLLWLGLIVNTQAIFATPINAILGAAAGYLILWTLFQVFKLVTGKEGMGYGDFKLLAALGAWFGIMSLPQIILIASLSSIVIGLVLALSKVRSMKDPVPFGPYLAIGGWTSLIFGGELIQQF